MDDQQKLQYEGLKWLFEMELLGHPQLINNLKMNVLVISRQIRDVEFLMDRENKRILVYVDLTWIGRKFYELRILQETEAIIGQLLPSFKCRATADPKLMNLAVAKVKKALGGIRETAKSNTDGIAPSPSVAESKGEPT